MRILPFRKAAAEAPRSFAFDWTQQELSEFYRAHRLLIQNGVSIGLDRGQSDLGDPWMVFYDLTSQDVFLHVARFEGRCVLVCEQFDLRLSRSSVSELILAFEAETRRYLSLQREKNGNVLVHPAARLIMSISALFLLFKLENGEAHAKGVPGEQSPLLAEAMRKSDASASALARASHAFGRLFDMADAPAAAAALAGAILSVEIARNVMPQSETDSTVSLGHVEHASASEAVISPALHDDAVPAVDPLTSVVAAVDPAQVVPELAAEMLVAIPVEVTAAETAESEASAAAQVPADTSATTATASRAVAADQVPAQSAAPIVTAASMTTPGDSGEETTQAVKAVQPLLAQLSEAASEFIASEDYTLSSFGQNVEIGDISIASLDLLDDFVGYVFQSAVADGMVTDKIIELIEVVGRFEVEIDHGRALIEQSFAGPIAVDSLGIWTNTMSDGSEITVIGQIDMVTQLTASLAA